MATPRPAGTKPPANRLEIGLKVSRLWAICKNRTLMRVCEQADSPRLSTASEPGVSAIASTGVGDTGSASGVDGRGVRWAIAGRAGPLGLGSVVHPLGSVPSALRLVWAAFRNTLPNRNWENSQ